MRVFIQRVSSAQVRIEESICGQIDKGLLVLAGFAPDDTEDTFLRMCRKILQLRIFPDMEGKMNLSVEDVKGALLIVSQFTLYADCKKGNRPSYIRAAAPEPAEKLYEAFILCLKNQTELNIQTGMFGADMHVSLINNGPVSIWLDSAEL